MTDLAAPPAELRALAAAVAALRPDWRDPERFYETRSELAARLRRLAAAAERRPAPGDAR